jgi:folate-binding Fe-S cluster repair protein YgfZ
VHLDKGCYRGQETIARVHHLGRPPRRLVLLHLDGIATDQPPAQGTPVTLDGRAVGYVGTGVRHHELGMIALAVLKRNVADDASLLVGESAAAIDIP